MRIEVEGKKQLFVTAVVFIGNNEYRMSGFDIGARESLDRGALCIYIVKRRNRAALVKLSLAALLGRLEQARDFESFTAPELVIETRRSSLLVATDGEVRRMSSPLHYRIRPRCLRVVVPRKTG